MCNKISAFWDWLGINIIFNSVVIFCYKFWLNLWDSFCFKQNSWDELSNKFWLNLWGSFRFTLIYTSIVICACLICADIYVKRQADERFLPPSKALKSSEIPDVLFSEILIALRLEFCTFACNKISLLSFWNYWILLHHKSCNICLIERIQKFLLGVLWI